MEIDSEGRAECFSISINQRPRDLVAEGSRTSKRFFTAKYSFVKKTPKPDSRCAKTLPL